MFFPFTICGRHKKALPLVKSTYITFYDYKNSKNNPCAASIFNETIFLEVNIASLSIQKKERKKNLNSNNRLGDTKFNESKESALIDNSK